MPSAVAHEDPSIEQDPATAEDAGVGSQDPMITVDNNRIRVVCIDDFLESEVLLRP